MIKPDKSIRIKSNITSVNVNEYEKLFKKAFNQSKSSDIVEIDFQDIEHMGSIAKNFILEWNNEFSKKGIKLKFRNMNSDVHEDLKLSEIKDIVIKKTEQEEIIYQIGDIFFNILVSVFDYFELFYYSFKESSKEIFRIKKGFRKGEYLKQLLLIGVNSLPIVGLIAFLFGIILSLQSAKQLAQFGAGVFIADIIGVSMSREMGPLITAIVLAGRSGSSIAAEIATMKVTEEVDALKVMGLDPVRFIVVPKFWSMTTSLPILTMFANLLGVLGGFLVALFYLDMNWSIYYEGLFRFVQLRYIFSGLFKSICFGWIITTIGCHYGFTVKGGAEGVGRNTTSSVVASIFWIIVADSFFSLVFYFF